jgi:hypothetical protein
MKTLKCLVIGGLSLVLFFCIFAYADTKNSVDISTVGMGARPIALGGAYAGLADDASAVFTNPGGIGLQSRTSFVSMSTQILTVVDYSVASVVYPTQYGVFGAGYIGVNSPAGDYSYIDKSGVTQEGGAMNYSQDMYVLSYGTDVSNIAGSLLGGFAQKTGFGANLKIETQGLSGGMRNAPEASGYSLDLGILSQINDQLSVGATLQNAMSSISWSTGDVERLDETLVLGTSYKVVNNVTLLGDVDFVSGQQAGLSGGVEWQAIQQLSLRAGFSQKDQSIDEDTTAVMTNYSVGLGLSLGDFRFDYSYVQDPNFDALSTNYFSICYTGVDTFTKKAEDKSADIKAPEIKGKDVSVSDNGDKTGKSDTYAAKDSGKGTILDQYMEMIDQQNGKVSQAQ